MTKWLMARRPVIFTDYNISVENENIIYLVPSWHKNNNTVTAFISDFFSGYCNDFIRISLPRH